MSSEQGVKGFYSGKNLFITGGSGFLGICLLEKILRTIPEHGQIYLLLRPKKGKEIKERLEEIKKNQVFEKLLEKESVEKVFSKVSAIAGDVGQDNLGLSPSDRKLLTDNVDVIFHSAATLDFGDTLKTTVNINLLGTRRVAELAKDCAHLKVLIHVSSAYVNSYLLEADEIIYPLARDADELVELTKTLSDEEMEERTPEILGKHPNTYTITKQMAEHEVQKIEAVVPCTIVRPSMIVGAWKEPIPGWTISKNGPQGFLMGAAKGVIRRLPVGPTLIYDYIPVDIVVNNLLTAGFYAAVTQTKKVAIFHSTSSTRNPFRWSLVEDQINNYLHEYPLKSAVWYPHLKFLSSVQWFKISAIFLHFIPALILDTLTKAFGGRPILWRLHTNVNTSLTRLEKFIFTEWRFTAVKTQDLHNWLNSSDKESFICDISDLDWVNYFKSLAIGARVYLNKEPLKNLDSAKKKDNILLIAHVGLQLLLYVLFWYLGASILALSMTTSIIIVPITYLLFNLL